MASPSITLRRASASSSGLKGQPDEFLEFSTEALLRSQFKDRIDALVKGVQGGIFSPNDARNMEGLDSVPFGARCRGFRRKTCRSSAASQIPSAPCVSSRPAVPLDPPDEEPSKATLMQHQPTPRSSSISIASAPSLVSVAGARPPDVIEEALAQGLADLGNEFDQRFEQRVMLITAQLEALRAAVRTEAAEAKAEKAEAKVMKAGKAMTEARAFGRAWAKRSRSNWRN